MDLKSPEEAELALAPEADPEPRGTPIGRRVVLGLLAAGTVGVLAGSRIQNWLEDVVAPVVSKDGTGLSSLLPIGRFRIYTVTGGLPSIDTDKYKLKVGGLVNTPTTFSYADLRAMEPTNLTRDFQCVTGWRVSDVKWRGVKLRDVLDQVGVADKGRAVRFYSFDGAYSESLTLEQARRNDVILAYELEGNDLSSAHGGPVRLYVAPMYGYKSIKWLGGIEVVKNVVPGYWEQRGYDVDAWVGRSNGRDDEKT
jgi:DMSO/TMAO reductase YedYZ molybdopterin-dependent catalytic subunit